ncbi:MAG: RnfABCDGE type electron transport complex subunit G [Acetivibrionales bacterium]
MGSIFKPALVLFIICLVVTAALAFTYSGTKDVIDERARIDAENIRREVLSNAEGFERIDGIEQLAEERPEFNAVSEAYKGLKDGSVIGYVFSVVSKGYGGNMSLMVGIDSSGKITDVRIGEHSETPGLGAKAADEPFRSQLAGIVPDGPLSVVKTKSTKPEEIEAISGATISSKAVVSGVQTALDLYAELVEKEGVQ